MVKKKFCPICNKVATSSVVDVCETAYQYLIGKIKKDHPEWVEKEGACPKCIEYYKKL